MENLRFKFRVWITVPITQDVEEEKEVSFYIYDIALYNDNGVGFSRDSLLEVLDKLNLTEGQYNEIEDYISDNSYSGDWEWYIISFDIIEQCTGLKDLNTKLIYDNDIVYDKIDECYKLVYWDNRAYCWALRWNNVCREPLQDGSDLEVIGNIHENKELLK